MGCVEIGLRGRDPDYNNRFEKSREGPTHKVTRSEEGIQIEEIKLAEIENEFVSHRALKQQTHKT